MGNNIQPDEINRKNVLWALDRLAVGFESSDPHIRHEAKAVARQNFEQLAKDMGSR